MTYTKLKINLETIKLPRILPGILCVVEIKKDLKAADKLH
jgi:hypothetical protein